MDFLAKGTKNFERTRKLIEELPFSYLHVFSYSPRSGTEAHSFRNNIKNATKKERNHVLTKLAKEKATLFHKSFVGKKVTVLIEDRKHAEGIFKGHSEHYIPVRVNAEGSLQNQLTPVLIKEVNEGEVVGSPQL